LLRRFGGDGQPLSTLAFKDAIPFCMPVLLVP
jgi:hypothetical protein